MRAYPDFAWDPYGGYWYERGYCLRDAVYRALGVHPLVVAIAVLGPYPHFALDVQPLLQDAGYASWIDPAGTPMPLQDIPVGPATIYLVIHQDAPDDSHAVLVRDPTLVLHDPDLSIIGYILLTDA